MVKTRDRHYIADRYVEITVGVAAIILGGVLLRDAYDSRGREQPKWVKIATIFP
jgi:hypothetical protein